MLFDQIIIYKLCKISRIDHAPEKKCFKCVKLVVT